MAAFGLIMMIALTTLLLITAIAEDRRIRMIRRVRRPVNETEVLAFLAWLESQHREPRMDWKREGF